MNTNNLKRFAQQARRILLEQVGARLTYVLTTDSPELREKTQQINQLKEELKRTTQELLVEKVAYTWFNRLMAHRFMDVNDYQPLGIKVITPKAGYTQPELLDIAKQGGIPEKLKVDQQKIYDLLDGKISSHNPQNEVYKELLIAASNHLHTILPFLFERINDYTELLVPDDLTSEFSIVNLVREGMLVEDCKNVEIIGWLYQFYISEEKDRLINAKITYKSYEIPAVTQLFTPKWIVQFMVDNTLGQFWKEARPKTLICSQLEFYLKPESGDNNFKRDIKSPEEIKFLDPCVGSAHILCYAFDVFYKIYEEEGYNIADVPELILRNNLYGIDIDDRAAQLAGFALMMKGRQYNRGFLGHGIIPNIIAFQNYDSFPKFKNAKTYGSLIKLSASEVAEILIDQNSIFSNEQQQLKQQAIFLSNSYDILVTNPPYMNSSYMVGELKQFVDKEYNSTKNDLFACFLMQAKSLTKDDGFIGFISPFVWMFISSYEELRRHLISTSTITSLIQLEYNAFEPACVPVATFALRNNYQAGYKGSYIRLSDFTGHENQAPKTLEAIKNPDCGYLYYTDQTNFLKIPANPIGYWLSEKFIKIFNESSTIEEIAPVRQGFQTGDNARYIRFWYEINHGEIGFDKQSSDEFFSSQKKYAPYNKGGEYRKWYGNNDYVVKFDPFNYDLLKKSGNNLPSRNLYFKNSITWSSLSSSSFGARYNGWGFTFSAKGACAFPFNEKNNYLLLALLNSKVTSKILEVLSPTLDFNVGSIRQIPLPKRVLEMENLIVKAENCVQIAKQEWDSNEFSWDFTNDSLKFLKNNVDLNLSEIFDLYTQQIITRYIHLHKIEEELSNSLIEAYGLKNDLDFNIPLESITLYQGQIDNKVLSKLNKRIIRNPETNSVTNYSELKIPVVGKETLYQYLSYSLGCMFGRYSLDKEGLILANQNETIQDYFNKIGKSKEEVTFLPDEDNVIPVLDNEWFEDDIASRFKQFLKVTFGTANFEKNLNFIEEQIDKDIRTYFIKDFYQDHIKRYKKRPIYWLFSSPNGAFNVLIYLHRYTQDTISIILNKYLREYQKKLKARLEHLQNIEASGSASEKTKAIKEKDDINRKLIELSDYEREIMYPMATERIAIDLDDGVLVNYNKFGKAVKEVPGLNDKKTKDAVKKFDWIDTTTIR